MTQPKITPDLVLATYQFYLRAFGRSSCGVVADDLHRKGYVSPRGKPISRMSVWRLMMLTNEGREAVELTRQRVGKWVS